MSFFVGNNKFPIVGGIGSLPPAYLSVNNHRNCLHEEDVHSYTQLCLPNEKPGVCHETTWSQLQVELISDKKSFHHQIHGVNCRNYAISVIHSII